MANTKISQLPLWSGSAADLRWFIMNNSDETETFKYSGYSSPYVWNNSTSGITETNPTKSSTFNARGQTNTETPNSLSNFVIGKGNTTGSQGMFMFVFGDDNTTNAGGGLGTADAIVNFGRANQIIGSVTHTAFVFGRGCISSAPRTFIFGEDTQAFGADSISMGRQNYANANESTSIGGSVNRITNSSESGIFAGKNNTISSSNINNLILGGNGNTISGSTTNACMVNCSNKIATENNTTYTENHKSFGQSYQGYYDNGSGSTFTIDWNNGNTQKMSLTGSGGITCDNTQTGAHYRMIINNPDGYTPSSFTAAGRTIKFNGGSFVVYSGESICELFITDDSVFVNQLGLFS